MKNVSNQDLSILICLGVALLTIGIPLVVHLYKTHPKRNRYTWGRSHDQRCTQTYFNNAVRRG